MADFGLDPHQDKLAESLEEPVRGPRSDAELPQGFGLISGFL